MMEDQILSAARNKVQTANNHEKACSGNLVTSHCFIHHNHASQTTESEDSCKKKVSSGIETEITYGGVDTLDYHLVSNSYEEIYIFHSNHF